MYSTSRRRTVRLGSLQGYMRDSRLKTKQVDTSHTGRSVQPWALLVYFLYDRTTVQESKISAVHSVQCRKIMSSVFQKIFFSAAIYINQSIFQSYLLFVLSVFSICYRQSLVYNPPCMLQFKKKKYIPQVGAKIKKNIAFKIVSIFRFFL